MLTGPLTVVVLIIIGVLVVCGLKIMISAAGRRRSQVAKVDQRPCPRCGSHNVEQAVFCSNCGMKLNADEGRSHK